MKNKVHKEDLFRSLYLLGRNNALSEQIQKLIKRFLNQDIVSKEYDEKEMEQLFPFQSIPEEAYAVEQYARELEEKLLPHVTNVSTSKFIGHMTSVLPSFIPDISLLITSLNQNVVKIETSQSATFYERQAIAMLHELMYENTKVFYETHIHLLDSTLGIITSGGTIANLTALQCARNQAFPTVEKKGISGFKGVVICSELGHYSIRKAMGLLGFGSDHLITIPTNGNNVIRLDALKESIEKCQENQLKVVAIVGIAGTTECGTIDPLDELARIASEHQIYFHVDAAWGGPVKFSKKYSHLLKGIEKADSITIDGHKQLYLPMGIGLILFKDPKTAKLIEKESEYIIRKTSIDLGKRSIEGSRASNSFYLQASLKLLGKEKYTWLINRGIYNSRRMAEYVDSLDDFELLTFPVTNIFLYRYVPEIYCDLKDNNEKLNDFNRLLQKRQMRKGNSFVSFTTVKLEKYERQPIVGLRVVTANPLINLEEFKLILNEQREIAKEL